MENVATCFKLFYYQTKFLQKFTIKVEKTFSRNEIIGYTFYSKHDTLIDFEKKIRLFSKNLTFKKKTTKTSRGLSKLHSTCFLRKSIFFEKKYIILQLFSNFEQKKILTFGEKFSARLSKLHSTCPDEHFRIL